MTRERWKEIEGFEGLYLVSNQGKVFSIPRNGTSGGFLKIYTDRYGYHKVVLRKNDVPHYYTVHRLVALAFVPNPDNKPQVNHIDNCKTNNYYKNLEWCTNYENLYHSHKQKRQRINATPVKAINKVTGKVFTFNSQREASRFTGVRQSSIQKHLTKGAKLKSEWRFEFLK